MSNMFECPLSLILSLECVCVLSILVEGGRDGGGEYDFAEFGNWPRRHKSAAARIWRSGIKPPNKVQGSVSLCSTF